MNATQAIHNAGVLQEVAREVGAQHDKWGEQNHPNGTAPFKILMDAEPVPNPPTFRKLAEVARRNCDFWHKDGAGSWADILLEEVFEAMAEEAPDALRTELVQVAAVCVSWIGSIDRASEAE